MTGNSNVIKMLNQAAKMELQGIQQYVIHRAMQENWGFGKLAQDLSFKHALDEMKHLDYYIDRVLFLEGTVDLSEPLPLKIGKDVPSQLEADLEGEYNAVQTYTEFAAQCEAEGDLATRDLFVGVIKDEEGHADHLETQMSLLQKLGLPIYLNRQI